MELPLTCDVCGAEIISDDESARATVISGGNEVDDDSEFFIAVEEASVEDGKLVVEAVDAFCDEHTPEKAHEY